jgi:hypothetical protein
LGRHQWVQAQQLLDRIFRIEDPPHLRWMRWVNAVGLGHKEAAARLYEKAWQGSTPQQAAINQTYSWHILGDRERCHSALCAAHTAGVAPDVINAISRALGLDLTIPPNIEEAR